MEAFNLNVAAASTWTSARGTVVVIGPVHELEVALALNRRGNEMLPWSVKSNVSGSLTTVAPLVSCNSSVPSALMMVPWAALPSACGCWMASLPTATSVIPA